MDNYFDNQNETQTTNTTADTQTQEYSQADVNMQEFTQASTTAQPQEYAQVDVTTQTAATAQPQEYTQASADTQSQQTYGAQPQSTYYGNSYSNLGYTNSANTYSQGYNQNNGGYSPYYGNPGYQQTPPQPEKQKKKSSGAFRRFLGVVACALVFGIIASGSFIGANKLYETLVPEESSVIANGTDSSNLAAVTPTIQATTVLGTGYVAGTAVSDLVKESLPFTVSINSTFTTSSWFGAYESTGSGSGIIVGQNETELLIVTNNHVVDSANSISVVLVDETQVAATLKGANSSADLAVVAVKLSDLSEETMNSIKIATLGNSDDVEVGEMVVAIGNALGYGQSVTVGYISAKDREVTVDGNTMILLQTDAAINPGNSGGALLNMDGEVIGINSVKYASEEVEGMGFAIPVSNVTEIIEGLMNRLSDEEKGYLGVYINEVTEEIANYYNWPIGIYVTEFSENSAAEEAGIHVSDIITAINGVTVKTTDELIDQVTSYHYGTTVTVTLQRNVSGVYQEMTLEVELRQSSSYTTVETTPTPTEAPRQKNPRN